VFGYYEYRLDLGLVNDLPVAKEYTSDTVWSAGAEYVMLSRKQIMVTACKMDLEMEEIRATMQRCRDEYLSSGFNHTKPRNIRLHIRVRINNSRIKKTEVFSKLQILNSNLQIK
jgi:hypothetical protein